MGSIWKSLVDHRWHPLWISNRSLLGWVFPIDARGRIPYNPIPNEALRITTRGLPVQHRIDSFTNYGRLHHDDSLWQRRYRRLLPRPAGSLQKGLMVSVFITPLAARATSPGKEGALGGQQDRSSFPGRKDSKGLHAEFFPQPSGLPCFTDGCRGQDRSCKDPSE